MNILFSQVSNIAIANIGWKYYLLFICLNAIDFIVIAVFFPDTKGLCLHKAFTQFYPTYFFVYIGKTLEEMAEIFGDKVDTGAVDDGRSIKAEEEKA